jgi:hypothetical protein
MNYKINKHPEIIRLLQVREIENQLYQTDKHKPRKPTFKNEPQYKHALKWDNIKTYYKKTNLLCFFLYDTELFK